MSFWKNEYGVGSGTLFLERVNGRVIRPFHWLAQLTHHPPQQQWTHCMFRGKGTTMYNIALGRRDETKRSTRVSVFFLFSITIFYILGILYTYTFYLLYTSPIFQVSYIWICNWNCLHHFHARKEIENN